MAKKRKSVKRQPRPDTEDEGASQKSASAEAGSGSKGADFFRTIGEGLKSAGQTAERYARMGVGVAELEKLRLELKLAYSKLGENVIKCWDAAPDIGVAANDPAVKEPVKAVKDLRRRIREIEIKIKTLQN
jgi:hypothetical protein